MVGQHFTVFGGTFIRESHGFNTAARTEGTLAVWGFVLASLLMAVTTVATVTVTASAWAHGAPVY